MGADYFVTEDTGVIIIISDGYKEIARFFISANKAPKGTPLYFDITGVEAR